MVLFMVKIILKTLYIKRLQCAVYLDSIYNIYPYIYGIKLIAKIHVLIFNLFIHRLHRHLLHRHLRSN